MVQMCRQKAQPPKTQVVSIHFLVHSLSRTQRAPSALNPKNLNPMLQGSGLRFMRPTWRYPTFCSACRPCPQNNSQSTSFHNPQPRNPKP